MKKAAPTDTGDLLTAQETAMLVKFREENGQRFPGRFFKHHSNEGGVYWIYRPLQGIGGTSLKYDTLKGFLESLVSNTDFGSMPRRASELVAG